MRQWIAPALAGLLLVVGIGSARADGSVVSYIEPKNATNPPPAKAFSEFQRFEVRPITMDAPYAGQAPNEEAKASIQANLDQRLGPLLAEWNAKPAGATPRTLVLEPRIEHVKFITGGKRFWAGAFAGGSAVLMTMKLTDAASGEVIAQPEFYQHANKMGAAWSFGATDKAMLVRIAGMIANYMQASYDKPQPTSTTEAGDVKF